MENSMAKMPRGQSRSTVDPVDQEMAKRRAQAQAQAIAEARAQALADEEEYGIPTVADMAGDMLKEFQDGPKMARPNLAQSFIPVVGPAWEAAADLQDGNYAGAAFNTGMAVLDVLPVGVAAKGLKAASKGVGVLKRGSVTANAARKALRKVGMTGPGFEVHHTIPLNGASRTAQDVRNHYALLKVLPVEQHRRLTGSWAGKPMYDPVRKILYGTTDWQKAVPTGVAAKAADAWQNLTDPFEQKGASGKKR